MFGPDGDAARGWPSRACWRCAMTMPACHPGARPPCGGWIDSTASPLRAISQEIREFEFHISPAPSSSRPHTGVGASGTSSSSRRAQSGSSLRRRGLSTASARSGMIRHASGEPRSGRGGGVRPREPRPSPRPRLRARRRRSTPAPARSRTALREHAPGGRSGRGRCDLGARADAATASKTFPFRRTE